MDTINFQDLGTNSAAFVAVRIFDELLAISISIEVDGDLDLAVSRDDARRIGQALLDAAGSA